MATLEQQREALEAVGLQGDELDKAMQGLANMRTTASIEVGVNTGDDAKYGDVSVYKVQPNGYRRTAMGARTAQIPGFIVELVSALEKLDPTAHEALIESFIPSTEDDDSEEEEG